MKKLEVRTGSSKYPIWVERGILSRAGKIIAKLLPSQNSRCYVVSAAPVWSVWGGAEEQSLAAAKIDYKLLEIADGERSKTLSVLEQLGEKMASTGADRKSAVIAFGGGVTGDLAGLLASMYMRGIALFQVPTTLLAQVDAAIGGKTAVNLRAGKNLLGTFHQPRAVISDPELLVTLPDRELRAGLFEVIKCGVIRDRKLFEALEQKKHAIINRDPKLLERVILDSARIKAQVVSVDERESDLRRILNFGHTIGHALEADTGYKHFLHGEAVGWGMAAAAMIGTAVRKTAPDVAQRIISAVLAYSPLPEVNSRGEDIVKRLQADKKTVNGRVNFVLPITVGKVAIFDKVPDDVVIDAVEQLHYLSRN